MFQIEWKKARGYALVAVLASATAAGLVPAAPAMAQSAPQGRGLPDFTDLVEQVGPAVVNIRTLEKRAAAGAQGPGAMDEEMQEFFRRFFGQPAPGAPRQAPRPWSGHWRSPARWR